MIPSRVHRLVSSADHMYGRFNIFAPPTEEVEWMTIGPQLNKQILTLDGNPIRFWIVGVVAHDGAQLVSSDGTAMRQASMCVHPVRNGEYNEWISFLDTLGGIQSTCPPS